MLYIMNSSAEIVILSPREVKEKLDLRSLGYYKIQHGILQQNLSKFYRFESAENVCNKHTKERRQIGDRRKISMVR